MRAIIYIATVAIIVAALFASLSMYVVDEREQAVVLQFGNPVAARTTPGLYFKTPFIQSVRYIPKTLQFWGGAPNDLLPDLPTKDGKKVEVTPWAVWRITDPIAFVKVLRNVDNASQRVQQFTRNAVRDTITQYDLSELVRSSNRELTYTFGVEVGEKNDDTPKLADIGIEQPKEAKATIKIGRPKILKEIRDEAHNRLREGEDESRGIEIVDVGLSRIEFVESVRRAAFQRLIKFMDSIAAYYTNDGERRKQEILNRTLAEVQRIEGEGTQRSNELRGKVDAEIIKSFAAAITEAGEFYTFLKTLDVYRKAITNDTRLILTTDSDFLRLLTQFKNVEPASTPASTGAEPAGVKPPGEKSP